MSDFVEKPKRIVSNFQLKKSGLKERVIEVTDADLDTMFKWFLSYQKNNIRAKAHSEHTIKKLESLSIGFGVETVRHAWIMEEDLKIVERWYKAHVNPSENDLRVWDEVKGAIYPEQSLPPSPHQEDPKE